MVLRVFSPKLIYKINALHLHSVIFSVLSLSSVVEKNIVATSYAEVSNMFSEYFCNSQINALLCLIAY